MNFKVYAQMRLTYADGIENSNNIKEKLEILK